jgi:predicted RNase H-like HicB family nuclease
MILDIIVIKEADGFSAEVPSLKGCESWAAKEDDVIEKIVELAKYYLKLNEKDKVKIDKARGSFTKKIYKLVIDKPQEA